MTTAEHADDALDLAARALLSPEAYDGSETINDAARLLRDQSPIHYVEHPDYNPVWVVTRHADVMEIEAHQKDWLQGGRPFLQTKHEIERIERGEVPDVRVLIDYDGDEHRAYRGITQKWFTTRNLNRLSDRITVLAKRAVDRMDEAGDHCDFAQDIAMHFPFETIMSLLGLPEADYPLMLDISRRVLGSGPEEDRLNPGSDEYGALIGELFMYFSRITEERQANPTEDLASVIANAELPGIGEMPLIDRIGYYTIFATAGHETTASSMSGGILALAQHPEQLQLLKNDPTPANIRAATDEILRWVTPLKHFCRYSAGDYTIGDHEFHAGDRVFMSYAAANRDERVFDNPDTFDITRTNAGTHLAFGFGAHHCLGAELARIQIRALLTELIPRLDTIDINGTPEYIKAISVSGLKHLPVHYKLHRPTDQGH
ncbi:cytochrome P450 [Mycolicibacterium sp. 624]|uniref:cytochrome P450 n=2 Tax=unclassified Mycolicibacterium TaxID=2636767 RepID=UPI003396CC64